MKKRWISIGLALVMSLSLVGCGSSSSKYEAASTTESGAYDYEWAEEAIDDSYDTASNGTNADSLSENESTSNDMSEKIITTYHYELETLEFDDLLAKITDRVSEYGGYIEESSINGSKEWASRYCHMVVRIPKKNAKTFLGMVEENSNVTSMSTDTENVTLKYVDLESHISSLQAEQEALLEMLKIADTVEEIILLQEQLTSVRYQIESYESQLRVLANRVSYDTIYMNIDEVQVETVVEPLSYGEEMRLGLANTFTNIGEGFRAFSLWFVINLPSIIIWVVIIGGIVFGIISIVRYNRRRKPFRDAIKREKEAKRMEELNKKMAEKAAKKGQPVPDIANVSKQESAPQSGVSPYAKPADNKDDAQ